MFTLGAAGGHLYQMLAHQNFTPGNAGIIFYMDIVIPIVGFGFLALWYRTKEGKADSHLPLS